MSETCDTPGLPELREDLQLLEGARTLTGRPTWLIFDPVKHKYFQLDQASYTLLGLWNRHNDRQALLKAADREGGIHDASGKLDELCNFVELNNLAVEARGGWRHYAAQALLQHRTMASWFMHSYLFFKIPLVRPHRFLQRTAPIVAPLFSKLFFSLVGLIGLAGAYLTVRQWDEFIATFQSFYTLEGMILYGFALAAIKIVHEFAHAYTAARYGCRVPTMGIAFLVMFPVLYTDVTDAWRLKSRRQRLAIGAAGMIAELSLAATATFLWAFLPDGTAKSIAFVVATISWALSLVVNLNPLMRFDGYYLLSDALGVENLQSRAFALGRWKLREWLFDLAHKVPEKLPGKMPTVLITYAWATWVYRFFLFIGIALIVYFFFFKALGVFLFIVEIIWFIARPVWLELKEWIAMRKQIFRRPRTYVTASIVAALIAFAIVPFATSVDVPAIIEAKQFERIYPIAAARVDRIHVVEGKQVALGDLLIKLESSELNKNLILSRIRLRQTNLHLSRSALDSLDRKQLLVLRREQSALKEQIAGLKRDRSLLIVRAPFAGRVADINRQLHAGRWVAREEPMMTIVNDDEYIARGYLAETDLWRVSSGASGTFIPDDTLRPKMPITVQDISIANASSIDIKYLASDFDGPIAVRRSTGSELVPLQAQYLVNMKLDDRHEQGLPVRRGLVKLDGKPESLIARVWRRTLQVLVRESGA